MRVKIVYLGGSRVQAGCDNELIEVGSGATLADVVARIEQLHPAIAPLLGSVRWARNFEFCRLDTHLEEGDEVAVLPPVSGGASRARVTREVIDPNSVAQRVADPSHGATVLFVGTVRDNAQGKSVRYLEYEAYEPMATNQLDAIAARAEQLGARVCVEHRHGRLEIGDISVVIAAASPHRAEAFDACRQVLEAIKRDVPIWKREVWTDGAEWVGWGGG